MGFLRKAKGHKIRSRAFPVNFRKPVRKEFEMSEFWWGLLWLSLFIPLMFLWGFALWDVFSRHDLKGWAKALWAIGIVFFPIAGLLVYFIARPKDAEGVGGYGYRDPYAPSYGSAYAYPPGTPYSYRPEQNRPDQYRRASGPVPDPNDIETIERLHESGALTDVEYEQLKERITSREPRAA